jgi:phage terminase large subunit-like protein
VAREIAELVAGCDIRAIAYDRWRIDLLKKEFANIGADLPLQAWGQGFKDMAPAIDALEAELLNGRVCHGNNPALAMCAANTIVTKDPSGSRKFDKSRATGRIDGMQALAMAMGIAQAAEETEFDMECFFV